MSVNWSSSLTCLGLKKNPFVPLPPSSEVVRQQVFTGRQEEVGKIINLLNPPRGIFLYGLFGVGKSILALEALRLLSEMGVITAYTKYERQIGFTKSALKGLAEACGTRDQQRVYEIIARGSGERLKGTATAEDIQGAVHRTQLAHDAIKNIMGLFKQDARGFVVVVDDLDKGTDVRNISDIILETRQLVELECSVILPGHNFGVTSKLGSASDILTPIPLRPLSANELIEMMGKYLALAHIESQEPAKATHPFSDKAANMIAHSIAETGLTPRIFNVACQLLLERAADVGETVINEKFVAERWANIASEYLVRSLRDEDKQHLDVIYKSNKMLSEDTRESIKSIGGQFAEYAQVRNILTNLIQQNVLIEQQQDGKRKLTVNPLMDRESEFFIIR
jgi:hypothetical protein